MDWAGTGRSSKLLFGSTKIHFDEDEGIIGEIGNPVAYNPETGFIQEVLSPEDSEFERQREERIDLENLAEDNRLDK